MFNDLFKEFSEEDRVNYIKEMNKIRNDFKEHIVPESYPDMISSMQSMRLAIEHMNIARDNMISLSSYCLVSKNWISELQPLLKEKKCLEIMSGLGMLSKAMQDEGINIIPTDSKEWICSDLLYWCDVEQIDAVSAIKKYGKNIDFVVCSWIPYNSNAGTEVLEVMRKINPSLQLIYIGERGGGCCANEEFDEKSKFHQNEYIDRANDKFKSWAGIHDCIYLIK